jgi:ribosome maturation factor RimP
MAQRGRSAPAWPGRAGESMAAGSVAAMRTRLRGIVEPIVTAAGFDLEGLRVSRAGRRHVVQVTVDRDGGVGHDELGVLSGELSAGLDAAEAHVGELAADPYTLEVSSPGVDRPLTLPRHWRRNVGRMVRVGVDGHLLTARVVAVDERGVTFDRSGPAVAFDRLGPGRVQVEFTREDEADGDEADGDEADGEDDAYDDRYEGDGEAADGDAAQLLTEQEAGP